MKAILLILGVLVLTVSGQGQGFGPSGYIKVRPHVQLFWWMYYTTADVQTITERPLLLWIPGGPGISGMGINFDGLGPLDLDSNPNNNSWVKYYNLLFVDVPVGTGLSYFGSKKALCTNNVQIGHDLTIFLLKFYQALPIFKSVPLYIAGLGYGAKIITEFAIRLEQAIGLGTIESNFKGIMLGNGFISPKDILAEFPQYYYQLGIVDHAGYKQLQKIAHKSLRAIQSKKYFKALAISRKLSKIVGDGTAVDMYNILSPMPSESKNISSQQLEELMNTKVYEELQLKSRFSSRSDIVFHALSGDIMTSVVDKVEYILNNTNIKVAVFASQFDGRIVNTATSRWVSRLNWTGADEYKTARREPLVIDGIVEGYVKSVENFDMYWIKRAGHITVNENPKAVADILRRLTEIHDDYDD